MSAAGGEPERVRPDAVSEPTAAAVCYRHPDRRSGVRCRRCERPICPDCMIEAPVGHQCPECVQGSGTRVQTMRNLSVASRPVATLVLIALNVAAHLPSLAGVSLVGRSSHPLAGDLALFGPAVDGGEWWRLVTSGFLHYGLMHLAFNMIALWVLGGALESRLGTPRFLAVYAAGLLTGSFGAVLLAPQALTAGASGAVFGLMGAAVVAQRRAGIDIMGSGIGGLLLINLLFTFLVPGISVGGHIGGLLGGAGAGLAAFVLDRRPWLGTAAAAAVAAAAAAGALLVA